MFICIGENEYYHSGFESGAGETVEEAIRNWAGDSEYMQQFAKYAPTIYEGKELKVRVKTKIVIIE